MNPYRTSCLALLLATAGCFNDRTPPRARDIPPDSLLTLPPLAPTDTVAPLVTSDSIGPLGMRGRFFTVLFQKEKFGSEEHVRRLQIRDERGMVHHDEHFDPDSVGGEIEWWVNVSAFALRGQHGHGIALIYEYFPTAPLSGVVLRAFGLQGARLAPIGPKLGVYGTFGGLQKSAEPNVEFLGPDETVDVEVWRGYFGVVVPLQLRLTGCEPAVQPCIRPLLRRTHAPSGLTLFEVRPTRREVEADTSVVLFDAPAGRAVARVPVLRDSQVEIIEVGAEVFIEVKRETSIVNTRNEWLRVLIDGTEGWIHGEESFGAIGLAQAG